MDHLILMKAPNRGNVASYTPPAGISFYPIPNNISQAIGTTLDMSQYIIDPDNARTSSAILVDGQPLQVPWFIGYDSATELLSFDNVGQAQNLTLQVCIDDADPDYGELMSQPLLTASQFEYIGSFEVPRDQPCFQYGAKQGAIAYDPNGDGGNGSLFIVGADISDPSAGTHEYIAEISIPAIKTSNYETASFVQNPVQACGGKQNQVKDAGNGNDICGVTVYNGRLIIHVVTYYDNQGSQPTGTFARSTNLSNTTVAGPCAIGSFNQRYFAGAGVPLPQVWRTEFDGYPVASGGGGHIAIASNQSNGPTSIFYDPDEVVGTNTVNATGAVYYANPESPGSFQGGFGEYFTGFSGARGNFAVNGYRTLVTYGRHSGNVYGSPVPSTNNASGAITDRFWLYDAADVKDAYDGTVGNGDPLAYEIADLSFCVGNFLPSINGYSYIRGCTFDTTNNLVYVVENRGGGNSYPRVHVVRINV